MQQAAQRQRSLSETASFAPGSSRMPLVIPDDFRSPCHLKQIGQSQHGSLPASAQAFQEFHEQSDPWGQLLVSFREAELRASRLSGKAAGPRLSGLERS